MKGFRKRWARATTDDAAEELEDDACARSTAGDPIVELGDGSLPPSLQWSPGAEPGESVCPNEPEASLGSWVEVSIDSEEPREKSSLTKSTGPSTLTSAEKGESRQQPLCQATL